MEQKQLITVRLNKAGVEELERMQRRYDSNKAAPMLEKALLMHLWYVDQIAELEKIVAEQRAIIAYLEGKNDDNLCMARP